MQLRFPLLALALIAVLLPAPAAAGEPVDLQVVTQIREEGFRHSQVGEILEHLTDGIGPRITNSPQMREASEWTRQKFEEWGLENAELHGFEFGNGWSYRRCSVHLVEPTQTQLEALPLAWMPGTEGRVRGKAMRLKAETVEDLEEYRGKLADKILFVDKKRDVVLDVDVFKRHDESSLEHLCAYELPDLAPSEWVKRRKKSFKLRRALLAMAKEEGAVAIVDISSRDAGVVRATHGADWRVGREAEVPGFALSSEHYNRILRHLEAGEQVVLEVDIAAQLHTGDPTAHNTLAEIPGRGKKDEIVMAGAHLDSWHGGTGATDNATGCAVVMEAARILKTLGLRGERTIRFVLWSGEEQGLLGSAAYAADHFATRPAPEQENEDDDFPLNWLDRRWPIEPKKGHEKFSAYFNLDNGGGKIRGVYAQENAAVVPIFNAWLAPFADLGAESVTMRTTSGTDHLSFDRVGLPGFQFVQDGMSYRTRTHHTNLDVYDHASIDDLKRSAVIMASFLYHAATRDEMIPRKPMPREPKKLKSEEDSE